MIYLQNINYASVVVSTVVYYIIGFLWYSKIFAGIWRKETGTVPETTAKPSPGALVGQFISTLLYTAGIAIFLKMSGTNPVALTAFLTLFFIVPVNTGNLFFTGKKRLFLLDVCERVLGTLVVGIILSVWP